MAVDRRIVRIGARVLGLVAAGALTVGALAAAALVPWPDHRAVAPSQVVQPAEIGRAHV